jgi:VanZ family protein
MLRVIKLWLPVIVWAAIILSAANDEFSNDNTRSWLERIFGDVPQIVNVVFRKGGHIVAYAILGLLAWRAQLTLRGALAIVLAVSIADETLQSTTLTREGSPYDVLLDTCGALLALTVVPAVRARLSSRARAG